MGFKRSARQEYQLPPGLRTKGDDPMERRTEASDILSRKAAIGDDREQMSAGSHYDYRAQEWVDGHDHAHFDDDRGPLLFCGADLATCAGVDQDYQPIARELAR